MGIGKKTKDDGTIDLENSFKDSFKSVNTAISSPIPPIELNLPKKKSLLKKVGSIPGTGVFIAALSSVCFSTGSLCCRLLDTEVNSNQVVVSR